MNSAQKEEGNIILIVVFVVLFLALLGGGYFLYQQTKANKSVPASSTSVASPSVSPAVLPSPTIATQNPVESSSSQNYQNPFDQSQNPFDNLQ